MSFYFEKKNDMTPLFHCDERLEVSKVLNQNFFCAEFLVETVDYLRSPEP